MRQVTLNLQGLTPPQTSLLKSVKRFLIACFGRQSGKTTAGIYLILSRALSGPPGGIYWFILQTHPAAEVVFNRFWDVLRGSDILAEKPNESEKLCVLVNGAKIFFKSGENFEDLRAETLNGVIIDEMRQQDKNLWTKVIRPMLARFGAWAAILSTSNGFDHFYDLFESAKGDLEWDTFHAPSTSAWWWTDAEIVSARQTMSEDEFAQEIMAEFREMGSGRVYTSHGPWNQSDQNPFCALGQFWSPHLPIVVGPDFNVGLMCWELGQVRAQSIHFNDEIELPWQGHEEPPSQAAAKILADKVKAHAPGVIIVGDASGKARKTSASETDYQLILGVLRAFGVHVVNKTPDANPPVKDRINVMNATMRDASGGVNFTYSPTRNKRLQKDCQRVKWKIVNGVAQIDKSDPELTHASDGAGYPTYHFCNPYRTRPGRMIVLQR